MICQECEEKPRSCYCPECEEYFCPKCEAKVHNKGKRILHKRVPINENEKFKILANFIFIEKSNQFSVLYQELINDLDS